LSDPSAISKEGNEVMLRGDVVSVKTHRRNERISQGRIIWLPEATAALLLGIRGFDRL
jgi:hypothetical protein